MRGIFIKYRKIGSFRIATRKQIKVVEKKFNGGTYVWGEGVKYN